MCPAVSNTYYQRVHVQTFLKSFWRRKWLGIVILITCLFLILILFRQSLSTSIPPTSDKHNTHMDDLPTDIYHEVVRRWYNFTDGEGWFNNKELSPSLIKDWERYLKEIRDEWIVWNHDANRTYFLEKPELEDPSMGQARVIREILEDKKNGFFVECGAYDGETRSNTLVLERFLGWTGLLIEADPINFSKMVQKNRKAFLSPTCLSLKTHPVVESFLMAKNVGRLHEPQNTTNVPENSPDVAHSGVHIQVQCFPFAHYLAALKVKSVDYFSLDIEGNEIDVLETIPFDQYDIKTLSVEHVHNPKGRKYLIDLMERQGYYVHSFVERSDNLANDVIFVKRES